MLYLSLRQSWLKFLVAWVACFLIRLIPGRPPNVEPILSTIMPLSKKFGIIDSAIFAFASMVAFDLFTGKVGIWTLVTAGAYAIVAIGAGVFLKFVRIPVVGYVAYAVIGTLLFDALTGLTIGPIFYDQPFKEAFTGQIPFTINHLIGNLGLSIILSPILERWIVENPRLMVPQPRRAAA